MKKILLTGANGFIGRHLCQRLVSRGYAVRAALRSIEPDTALLPAVVEQVAVGTIDGKTDWQEALQGVDCVVHLAARVHVMKETHDDPIHAFRQVNSAGSERLARQAAQAGVKRLVYLSSIKVNGEVSGDRPFRADDSPNPQDPYGRSKWEAEQRLAEVAAEDGLEVVVLRSPLVYGPGVKGNFIRLLKLVDRALPLPLGAMNSRRSIVAVDNLCDLVVVVLEHPKAANRTFLLSDGDDISSNELVQKMARVLERPCRLLSVPLSLMKLVARLTGKTAEIERLSEPLQIDISQTQQLLDWQPPVTIDQALEETAAWYRSGQDR